MRRTRNLLLLFGALLSFNACKEEAQIDTPNILSYQTVEVAYMGDSIPLVINADGQYRLSSIKVTFFQDDERIS